MMIAQIKHATPKMIKHILTYLPLYLALPRLVYTLLKNYNVQSTHSKVYALRYNFSIRYTYIC